jgi:hypothetical protein
VLSIEIAFRRKSVQGRGLQFDECFGLGAEFPTAEENIFLIDALNGGSKIAYWPEPIVMHHGRNYDEIILDKAVMIGKGAFFSRLFGRQALLWAIAFALKKYPVYRGSMTMWSAFKYLREGQRLYQKQRMTN